MPPTCPGSRANRAGTGLFVSDVTVTVSIRASDGGARQVGRTFHPGHLPPRRPQNADWFCPLIP
ncbi:hypothetical protein FRUB_01296 [Fimbriiglobus ruber]|uniref:Uncharacterized protein n=1 Tax=Fimbriiglobus ruber TaxID=1908690 RepID=A0A225E8M0_9BACT|nr:hypothetical protein FRUB_01296 [Fimbriiglobus ruber]